MIKEANLSTGFSVLNQAPVGLANAPKLEQPELPETPKASVLKLTDTLGTKRPKFTHETKSGSPYNPN
jgi:hypothetical protein